jgi:hypothetical protein
MAFFHAGSDKQAELASFGYFATSIDDHKQTFERFLTQLARNAAEDMRNAKVPTLTAQCNSIVNAIILAPSASFVEEPSFHLLVCSFMRSF